MVSLLEHIVPHAIAIPPPQSERREQLVLWRTFNIPNPDLEITEILPIHSMLCPTTVLLDII